MPADSESVDDEVSTVVAHRGGGDLRCRGRVGGGSHRLFVAVPYGSLCRLEQQLLTTAPQSPVDIAYRCSVVGFVTLPHHAAAGGPPEAEAAAFWCFAGVRPGAAN